MKARGTVRVPGDKSISHRALICAAIASGGSHITNLLRSADVESTASVLRVLGVSIPALADEVVIEGVGFGGLREPGLALQCGNSGTTARMLAGVVAASPFATRLEGDPSLSRRPMRRVTEPLTAMGARIEFERDDGLPMTVYGGDLSGIAWNTRASSAQTKSAILFAGLLGGVSVTVREARRSRDHTERMLASVGVPLTITEASVTLTPVAEIEPLRLTVPADPSSAAYLVALGALADEGEVRIPGVCVNPTRTGFLTVLARMGGSVRFIEKRKVAGEETGTVVVAPRKLHGIRVGADEVPAMIDELPLLACVAAASGVDLDVSGAEELRVKESDRISAVVSNLRAIGAQAEERRDGFRISAGRRPLRGRVATQGDHRIAMAFGVIGWVDGNDIEVDDRDCVDISYPTFWSDVAALVQ
ncbi:MAG TPA: 3-phosphoshikimate 1-carboxyvinyltransferase [Gemmatimonadaceae bacterium]|nr:3-phosphoshikimate 1-carboxyvinyltransferase [Gemmatimonadaceae bacterium]